MLTLVLGGTRSGKSGFAVGLAAEDGRPVTFLATGVASDDEMRERIEAHRRARPPGWTLVEEPSAIADAVPDGAGAVLLDSVDTWLANRMEAIGGPGVEFTPGRLDALVAGCAEELVVVEARTHHLVAVSAEVGLSLLPPTPYGRAFVDALGQLNQRLAARADRVFLVVAGIPLPLLPRGLA
jgi:adenosylcobinamide kinase/adenosylcobinamide-phosphate guanylyltransferase